jgi:Bacteriophage baseplate protein W
VQIAFPLRVAGDGIVVAGDAAHLRDLIEQVLFTRPGERVNRPDFGAGIDLVVFEPGNTEVIAATQALVRASLQKWLGDLLTVERVGVEVEDSTLTVTVQYVDARTRDRRTEQFAT